MSLLLYQTVQSLNIFSQYVLFCHRFVSLRSTIFFSSTGMIFVSLFYQMHRFNHLRTNNLKHICKRVLGVLFKICARTTAKKKASSPFSIHNRVIKQKKLEGI